MSEYQYITPQDPDGATIGSASTSLIAFHGGTPCDQAAAVSALGVTGCITGGVGFETSAHVLTFTTAVNSILAVLEEKGLLATS